MPESLITLDVMVPFVVMVEPMEFAVMPAAASVAFALMAAATAAATSADDIPGVVMMDRRTPPTLKSIEPPTAVPENCHQLLLLLAPPRTNCENESVLTVISLLLVFWPSFSNVAQDMPSKCCTWSSVSGTSKLLSS